ncbi:MAG TPA: outer membrane beta-barrel protein [Steroidobacteraceae bacterium]
MHQSLLAVAVIAAAISLPAHAADNGIYLGASAGQSGVHFDERVDGTNLSYDADATGYKLIGGWRVLNWLAVEGNYVDLGSGSDKVAGGKFETSIDGLSVSALGLWAVGPVDLYVRAGAINWNADVKSASFGVKASDNGTDLTYGVGAQFRIWSLSLRAEYERFEISDIDTVDLATLGVTWTFL